jgi:hypothetical protein
MSFVIVMNALQVYLEQMFVNEITDFSSVPIPFDKAVERLKVSMSQIPLEELLGCKKIIQLIESLEAGHCYERFGRSVMLLWLYGQVGQGIDKTQKDLQKIEELRQEKGDPGLIVEKKLHDYFFGGTTGKDSLVKYISDRTFNETFRQNLMFYQQVATATFQILQEHQTTQPVFLDQELEALPPFLRLAQEVLCVYVILSQLSQWTFEVVKGADKTLSIKLIPGHISVVQDVVSREKACVALGILGKLHAYCKVPDLLDKKTAQVIFSVFLEDAIEVRPMGLISSMKTQRLEELIKILMNASKDYFLEHKISLVDPKKLPSGPETGFFSVVCGLTSDVYNFASSLVFTQTEALESVKIRLSLSPRASPSNHMS